MIYQSPWEAKMCHEFNKCIVTRYIIAKLQFRRYVFIEIMSDIDVKNVLFSYT